MKVMLVGGGSGGHLTPLLAVAHELKRNQTDVELVYVGHRSDKLNKSVTDHNLISKTHVIFAGKFRRYHGRGVKQLLDLKTILKNVIDGFYLLLGLLQSLLLLKKERPSVIFIRGGFVGVPIGWAARFWRIPYLTHDSDAIPSLANRLISKKAHTNAVALPKHLYKYPSHKTVEVGVPISSAYKKVTSSSKKAARNKLGIPVFARVLFVTGGGLGAQRINRVMAAEAANLFKKVPDLFLVHQAGQKNESEVKEAYSRNLSPKQLKSVLVYGFTDEMAILSAAADVVIARAGATAMAELALQGKAVIMVPNAMLTGGHQLKNAEVYESAKAALLVSENRFKELVPTAVKLLLDSSRQADLGERLAMFAKPDASARTAELILKIAKGQHVRS